MIRKAELNNIASINRLGKTIYSNFENLYKLNNYLKNDNYVILINEEIVINGFIIVYKNVDYFEIEMIVVNELYRNKGIATNLLNYFIDNYCKKGDELFLEVSTENSNALKLYKKFNFELINIRKKYYKNSDAYILKKVIN